MKKKFQKQATYLFFSLLLMNALFISPLSAQGENNAQAISAFEIMEKVSSQLKMPAGLNKGQLTVTSKEGKVRVYKFSQFLKGEHILYLFDSISAGRVKKVLVRNLGFNIYVYDIHSRKFYHKMSQDKFDRLLGSGYSYFDITNSPFLDNYTPSIDGEEKRENSNNWIRVKNKPLDKGKYSKMNVLVDPENDYQVKRIDYFDTSGVLMKSQTFTFSDLSVKNPDKTVGTMKFAVKFEMMDMSQGTISVLEFFKNDKTARIDDSMFDKANIEK